MIIRDSAFEKIADSVKPDSKKRVVLQHIQIHEGVTYHIYTNSTGQIVLDPQVTIPASELWVFEDKEILASIDRGMADSVNGRIVDRGSFAKYVKNAP
ncbi:MAG: hypothetical protein PHO26_08250 [Dehalococcoidia bacterium]|nr:hypothetical protein [Dehalococcoidia bacterium]MDD5494563.1 hypothetical protein [Dehalococcoidia bacterium]